MKIKVTSYKVSDDDCRRYDFVTVVDGVEYNLDSESLGNDIAVQRMTDRAKAMFGHDVELVFED